MAMMMMMNNLAGVFVRTSESCLLPLQPFYLILRNRGSWHVGRHHERKRNHHERGSAH